MTILKPGARAGKLANDSGGIECQGHSPARPPVYIGAGAATPTDASREARPTRDRRRATNYVLALAAVAVTVFMVIYSRIAFEAAVSGLRVWWDIVFPALLPFFIGSEILMGLGVVHFMGVLLEPIMRPAFNVPGAGSFVLAMGLASGYPIGSILTARLRRQELVNKVEGERLMSFTNTADPLFMSGAVAVGMFGVPAAGGLIIAAHYLSSIALGVLLRFWGGSPRGKRGRGGSGQARPREPVARPSLRRALDAMIQARERDDRSFGQLMGDAVKNSVSTLLLVGGFIILFSVIIRILDVSGVVGVICAGLGPILKPLGLQPTLARPLISGFLEITIGTQAASRAAAPLLGRLVVAGAIIAWSGLSVHAQVAAMVQGTDLNVRTYVVARVLHAALAAGITALLWPLFGLYRATSLPAAAWWFAAPPAMAGPLGALGGLTLQGALAWLGRLGFFCEEFMVLAAGLALVSVSAAAVNGARLLVVRLPHRRG